MGASSVTGVGQGSANKISPPLVKSNRIQGTKILECGYANMSGGITIVNHKPVENYDSPNTVRLVSSNSAFSVFVFGFNENSFEVHSLETGSSFSFYWAIMTNS